MLHVFRLYLFVATEPLFHLFSYKSLFLSFSILRFLRTIKNASIQRWRRKYNRTGCRRGSLHQGRSAQWVLRFHNYGRLIQILGRISGKNCKILLSTKVDLELKLKKMQIAQIETNNKIFFFNRNKEIWVAVVLTSSIFIVSSPWTTLVSL